MVSYLKDRQHFVSINGYNSECASMSVGVPQGLFINLNLAIKHCKVHHFANDTNLLYTNNSIKKLNTMLNKDLKDLTN